MTGTRDQFIPGIYRQHILAGIIIAGHQHVGIDTHGGGPGAAGSHLTATFGEQLMITLYDMAAATTYIQAWLADEDQWIFAGLPVEVPTIHGQGSIGPALSVRAHDDDDSNARIRRSTPRSFGSLITVSIRNARPSLKYSFTLECLYPTLMVTSTPLPSKWGCVIKLRHAAGTRGYTWATPPCGTGSGVAARIWSSLGV
jgi:hypothetical protein